MFFSVLVSKTTQLAHEEEVRVGLNTFDMVPSSATGAFYLKEKVFACHSGLALEGGFSLLPGSPW